jgi:polysaccharide deacetylase family protein (PEP-CTERM system associated)
MHNAMTVDVEDYFHVSAFENVIERASWDLRESRVKVNTQRLLELFEVKKIHATFFVLGWVAERFTDLVREIAQHGHEVACHGYSHKLVYKQTPQEFHEETKQAKAIIEDQIQKPVLGYRAASYSITENSLWALDILAELGFHYDSSIFPVRHDRYGIPASPRWPYQLHTLQGHTLVEFPLTTARWGKVKLPVAGGGYFRLYPYQLSKWAFKRVNEHDQQPFIFYLHPWEIDPEQPRIEASLLSRFRHYNNLERCHHRLEKLVTDFPFTTVTEVLMDRGFLSAGEPAASSDRVDVRLWSVS